MNNKLKKTITNQFQSLENHLDNIRNWQIETEEELWDAVYYQDLLNELKELVTFLEDDNGLINNLETWQNNNEQNDDDE